MQMSVSFIRYVEALMADSGLSESLESTFGEVSIMLSGENPLHMRVLRLLVEDLLRQLFVRG